MSKAIKFNEIHKLVTGLTIFHVIGAGHNIKTIKDISEIEIVQEPYNDPIRENEECLWIEGICKFWSNDGDDYNFIKSQFSRKYSLGDAGCRRNGKVHNLNRFFWTHEDAEAFIVELNNGVFSDPIDQEQCDKREGYWW